MCASKGRLPRKDLSKAQTIQEHSCDSKNNFNFCMKCKEEFQGDEFSHICKLKKGPKSKYFRRIATFDTESICMSICNCVSCFENLKCNQHGRFRCLQENCFTLECRCEKLNGQCTCTLICPNHAFFSSEPCLICDALKCDFHKFDVNMRNEDSIHKCNVVVLSFEYSEFGMVIA